MKYNKRIGRLERKSKNTISIFRRIIDKMNLINEGYNKFTALHALAAIIYEKG